VWIARVEDFIHLRAGTFRTSPEGDWFKFLDMTISYHHKCGVIHSQHVGYVSLLTDGKALSYDTVSVF